MTKRKTSAARTCNDRPDKKAIPEQVRKQLVEGLDSLQRRVKEIEQIIAEHPEVFGGGSD